MVLLKLFCCVVEQPYSSFIDHPYWLCTSVAAASGEPEEDLACGVDAVSEDEPITSVAATAGEKEKGDATSLVIAAGKIGAAP